MHRDVSPIHEHGALPRLLLVEDNPLHVRLVRTMLEEMWPGYDELTHAPRLSDAIEAVHESEPDCVLLDLFLPDADGLEAVNAMLAEAPDIPIVVLSAHDDEVAAMHAVREGAQDYLVKGAVSAEELVKAVRFAMQRPRPLHDEVPAAPPGEVATAVVAVDGTVMAADDRVRSMLGAEDLLGAPVESVIHEDDADVWRVRVATTVRTRKPAELIVRFRGDRGHQQVRVELTPMVAANGEVSSIVARCFLLGDLAHRRATVDS